MRDILLNTLTGLVVLLFAALIVAAAIAITTYLSVYALIIPLGLALAWGIGAVVRDE